MFYFLKWPPALERLCSSLFLNEGRIQIKHKERKRKRDEKPFKLVFLILFYTCCHFLSQCDCLTDSSLKMLQTAELISGLVFQTISLFSVFTWLGFIYLSSAVDRSYISRFARYHFRHAPKI